MGVISPDKTCKFSEKSIFTSIATKFIRKRKQLEISIKFLWHKSEKKRNFQFNTNVVNIMVIQVFLWIFLTIILLY